MRVHRTLQDEAEDMVRNYYDGLIDYMQLMEYKIRISKTVSYLDREIDLILKEHRYS